MTDLIPRPRTFPDRSPDRAEQGERNTALTVYGLYLAAPFTAGITGLVGALIAKSQHAKAGPSSATWFRHQVWTFGVAAGAAITGGFWATVGGIASTANPDGGPLALIGGALAASAGIGFIASSLFGLSRTVGREPIGRPE